LEKVKGDIRSPQEDICLVKGSQDGKKQKYSRRNPNVIRKKVLKGGHKKTKRRTVGSKGVRKKKRCHTRQDRTTSGKIKTASCPSAGRPRGPGPSMPRRGGVKKVAEAGRSGGQESSRGFSASALKRKEKTDPPGKRKNAVGKSGMRENGLGEGKTKKNSPAGPAVTKGYRKEREKSCGMDRLTKSRQN